MSNYQCFCSPHHNINFHSFIMFFGKSAMVLLMLNKICLLGNSIFYHRKFDLRIHQMSLYSFFMGLATHPLYNVLTIYVYQYFSFNFLLNT